MSYTALLRKKADSLWEKEYLHPFVQGIGSGTLELEKFQHYMKQDYLFLIEFSKVISLAIAKCKNLEDMGWCSALLNETLNTEMSLHVSFCKDFDIGEKELLDTKMSPATHSYTRHLLEIGYSGSTPEIATAILPCSWGYSEIGKRLFARGLPSNSPLYSRWIEMYNSDEFEDLAIWIRQFIDREVQNMTPSSQEDLENIFFTSSKYEYRFWDSAYNLETW
ncbi:MAG TPA: thiaminase II [Dehalococcoidia bacterium]|nr:thiaminase II [Dehalococcoidia bacterium]